MQLWYLKMACIAVLCFECWHIMNCPERSLVWYVLHQPSCPLSPAGQTYLSLVGFVGCCVCSCLAFLHVTASKC